MSFFSALGSRIKRGQPTKSPQSPHVVTAPRSLTKCTVGIGKQIPKGNENRLMKTTDRLSARHLVAESIKLGQGSIPAGIPLLPPTTSPVCCSVSHFLNLPLAFSDQILTFIAFFIKINSARLMVTLSTYLTQVLNLSMRWPAATHPCFVSNRIHCFRV